MKHAIPKTFALLTALLVFTGCGPGDDSAGASGAGANAQRAPQQVRVLTAEKTAIRMREQLPGRVVAFQTAEIRPQVSGIIQSRQFAEGSFVEEGQQLYQIDPERYEAELQMARASLADAEARQANARVEVERFSRLLQSNSVSQQQFDDAQAELNRAEAAVGMALAEVRSAEINLRYTAVRSPISGFISPSNVTKGALVTAQQPAPLATVRQLDPIYVDLSQTATKARLPRPGRDDGPSAEAYRVEVELSGSAEQRILEGRLDATDFAVDPRSGSIILRAVFNNPELDLIPGMFVRGTIINNNPRETILVPQEATQITAQGQKRIWIVTDDGTARQRDFSASGSHEGQWIVESGIVVGDRMIIGGFMNLRDGTAVEIQPEEAGGQS